METKHTYDEHQSVALKNVLILEDAGLSFKKKQVLDVGCGTGAYSRAMVERGAYLVVGIDSEEQNIDSAMKKDSGKRIIFLNDDILSWQSRTSFDTIFIRGTAYYLTAPIHITLKQLIRFMKPGADFYITFLTDSIGGKILNLLKFFLKSLPLFTRPPIKFTLAMLVFGMSFLLDKNSMKWSTVLGKMNSIFFPVEFLISQTDALLTIEQAGLVVVNTFGRVSQIPWMSGEFAVWAKLPNEDTLSK